MRISVQNRLHCQNASSFCARAQRERERERAPEKERERERERGVTVCVRCVWRARAGGGLPSHFSLRLMHWSPLLQINPSVSSQRKGGASAWIAFNTFLAFATVAVAASKSVFSVKHCSVPVSSTSTQNSEYANEIFSRTFFSASTSAFASASRTSCSCSFIRVVVVMVVVLVLVVGHIPSPPTQSSMPAWSGHRNPARACSKKDWAIRRLIF